MNPCKNLATISVWLLAASLFAGAPFASAQVNLTTERYDQARTGANLNETQLTTSNVNVSQFGKLWSYTVSGSVQAQPLYVQGVNIAGQPHNVLYVVTMNDMVYAFDADSNSNTPLWSVSLLSQVSGSTPVPIVDIVQDNTLNIVGNIGIESTPYIDLTPNTPTTNTMYLVARTKEPGTPCGSVNGNYCQRLHALDITSGAERFGGPTIIQGSVSGTGSASSGGTLTFDPEIHNQRSSLAMANGQLFMSWSSHEDLNPYHGWIMAYDATTLQQTAIWCNTPNGSMGGIWMAGRGPAVDASGNIYYMTGNGDWNGVNAFSESMLKFGSTSGMPLLDYFTPDSWSTLTANDTDYGSSGPLLIPGTDLVVGGGKSGVFYLMHTGSLGHERTGNGQIVQSLDNQSGEIHGGPVYWNRSSGAGPWMYVWADGADVAKAYHFNGSTFDTTIVSEGTILSPNGESGGVLTLSANGSAAGSGIIWSSIPLSDNGDHGVHPGVLRALNADDLTQELWNSTLNATRDNMGNWPKYSPPTVLNGRVYMVSFPSDGVGNTALNVYGLLSKAANFAISVTPGSVAVGPSGSANYPVSTTTTSGYSGTVSLSVTGLPPGATASWTSSNTVTAGTGATLTVATSASTPVGSFTLTINGTDGILTHSATTILVVSTTTPGSGAIGIDFVGGDTPMGPTEVAGVVPKANWNDASGATGNGVALVDETGTATGATVTWSASSVWTLPIADTPGDFRMMKGYLDSVGQNTVVTVAGLPTSATGYDIYVYADGDDAGATRTGNYQISGAGITTASTNVTDIANFSGTYAQASNSSGNYAKFTIAATAFTLTATPGAASDGVPRAPVNGIQIVPHVITPDYSFSVSPSSQTVTAGNSTAYTINVTAVNGFVGSVALSASGLPTGATANFSTASISGTGSSTLTVSTASATAAGSSALTISGTSGSLTHSGTVSLVVGAVPTAMASLSDSTLNFAGLLVGSTSGARSVSLTNNGTAALNITGISISGSADFSQTNNCGSQLAAGVSCAIQVTFHPTQGGNRTGSLMVTDAVGGQETDLFGIGMDFSVTSSPSSANVTAGQTASFSMTVTAIGGFSQAVSLACSGAPATTTCAVSPSSVTPNGSAPTTVPVTIATTARSLMWPALPRIPAGLQLQVAGWLLALGIMVVLAAQRKQRTRLAVCTATLVIIAIAVAGCAGSSGGGSSTSTPPPPSVAGTPAGTYTITITATSGNLTQATTYTLTVN